MKKNLLLLLFITSFSFAQVIKDSILGKPKFVKEYVLFLNESGPRKFMEFDDEYGHATNMSPENLRQSMRTSWFETNFCRYINNETSYNKNHKITKETWFYKNGEIVDDYNYTYDHIGRLSNEKSVSKNSSRNKKYIYKGSSKKLKFTEYSSKWKDEPTETFFNNREGYTPFIVTKYDTLSKIDSIFTITDFIWKKVGENSFQEGNDSIFRKKLTQVNFYDDNFQIKEAKFFDYKLDRNNVDLFQDGSAKYEYDSLGRVIKETQIKDDKYHYFILEKNGKYREEVKEGGYASVSSIEYSYNNVGKLKTRTYFYQGNISDEISFEYNNDLIAKLYYLDTWGKEKKDIKPTLITFKYKFDKNNNWTECIKNVDGKDLYLWKREIKYY